MKNRNGFTLIELLGVIILLALLTIMLMPVIKQSTDKAKKESFLASVNGIYRAVKTNKDYGKSQTYTITNGKVSPTLDVKGEFDGTGKIYVNEEGEISVAVSNKKYCASKDYTDKKITVKVGACK